MSDSTEFDVVVVGYGPTGLAATSLLARLGHRVAAFERWPGLYGLPRAVGIDAEAVRILQASGDLDVALAESSVITRYIFKNGAGDVLVDFDWREPAISGFPDHVSMYQPRVEDALDTAARERGATVYQGWEVMSFEQDDDGVTVTARNRDLGEEMQTRAKWLIGADGANSTIRTQLGIEREDLGSSSAFLNLDVNRVRPFDEKFEIPTLVCGPPRMHVALPIGELRYRFEYELLEGDDWDEHLRPETAWRYLREWHDLGPEDLEIYRQIVYVFESKLAPQWRVGRVFLAGDAAHQMSPFVGQGAVSGLRDAIALAWRFDLVLRGISDDSLLDSYQLERLPHVRDITLLSGGLGAIAMERDAEVARVRDEQFKSGPPQAPPLPRPTDGVLRRDADGELDSLAGQLGPQGKVSYEGRTGLADDVLGWGFALLCRGMAPLSGLSDEHRAFLDSIGGRTFAFSRDPATNLVRDVDGIYERFFDEHGVVAVLVRPDFFVFGAAQDPSDVAALLEDLREQLGASVPA